jgi:hypothetical protein
MMGRDGLRQIFWGLLISVRAIFWLHGDLRDHRDAVGLGIHVLAGFIGVGLLAFGVRAALRTKDHQVGPAGGTPPRL